jgi:hypothetical protein
MLFGKIFATLATLQLGVALLGCGEEAGGSSAVGGRGVGQSHPEGSQGQQSTEAGDHCQRNTPASKSNSTRFACKAAGPR